MGLDISVYNNVKLTTEEDYDFTAFVVTNDWLYKIKNLKNNGYYKGDYADGDVSYSYSTHNRFREELLKVTGRQAFLLEDGTINWEILQNASNVPFYELIWFADNEGCLDWEVNQKLYKEFLEWEDKAVEYLDEYYRGKYLDWLEIFASGKEKGGVVVFH